MSLLVLAVLAIVVAGGVLLPAPTRLCDLLGGAPAVCPGSYPWTGPAWWSLLVLMLFSVAVLLRNQVRVDESGVTHRTLLRTRTLTRDQLDAAILHRYLRHSRSGTYETTRLSVRLTGGRYGFMMTSDMYPRNAVEWIAKALDAVPRGEQRPIDLEAAFPGATRWAQRHPVALAVIVGAVTLIVALVLVATW